MPSSMHTIGVTPMPSSSTSALLIPSSKPTSSPQLSTLRKKAAEIFSSSPFSSKSAFEPDDFEMEGRISPSKTIQGRPLPVAGSTLRNSPSRTTTGSGVEGDVYMASSTPTGSPTETAMSYLPATPSYVSTLRQRTDELELFSVGRHSPNPFNPNDDELDDASLDCTVRGNPQVTVHSEISTPQDTVGERLIRSPAIDSQCEYQIAVPLKTPVVSPRYSTLMCKSADICIEESDLRSPEDGDFATKLESMRLNPTQRVRGNPLKSMRSSPLPTKRTPSPWFATVNKENPMSSYFDQKFSPTQRNYHRPSTCTEHSPTRSARCSPLRSVHASLEKVSPTTPEPTEPAKDLMAPCPVSSIWNADDDEFEHWPEQKDLEVAVKNFTIKRGTFTGTARFVLGTQSSITRHVIEPTNNDTDNGPLPPLRSADLTEQEHEDFMHELNDMNYGNPDGIDAHDEIMEQFYQRECDALPITNPAGIPHLFAHKAYLEDEDSLVRLAYPRLCDAIVTVLYLTGSKCLADFLNPNIQVFEWRRSGNCLMIRREGNGVIVGTFRNFATCYVWTYFVRSTISDAGAWKEVYAGASQITTPITVKGVDFEKFRPSPDVYATGVDPTDEKFALYMGRRLGLFLLKHNVWDFRGVKRWAVVWEADGVVTDALEYSHEILRSARESEE